MRARTSSLSLKDKIAFSLAGILVILALTILTPVSVSAGAIAALSLAAFIWLYGLISQNPSHDNLAPTRRGLTDNFDEPRQAAEYRGEARLANSLHEALIIINPKEDIVFINQDAQRLFPLARSGQPLTTVLRDPDILSLVRQAARRQPGEAVLVTLHTPLERYYRVTATPLYEDPALDPTQEAKNRERIVIALQDVTDMERQNAVQADFLANASHELKTPVASLLGYIETLGGHAKDDAQARQKFLGIMQQQAERMQRLINDLLSLRRIEQTEHIAPADIADFDRAVGAAIESLSPLADARQVKIERAGEIGAPVKGQSDELVQLILNLVDNAIKMNPPKSEVRLSLERIPDWQSSRAFSETPIAPGAARRNIVTPPERQGAYAVLRIRDVGPGIPKDHIPRIGERFYRIAGDRDASTKGTGLGLAIVKHITLRHRGGLSVESAPGAGTEFSLIIPLA